MPPECNCNTIRALKLCPEIVGEGWGGAVVGGAKKIETEIEGKMRGQV